MTDSFEVKKKEDITSIKWSGIEIILIPRPSSTTSQVGGNVNISPTGIGAGAYVGKQVLGDVFALINEAGKIEPLDVWNHRKEIEAGLLVSGIVANISSVGTVNVSATAAGSSIAAVTAHNPKCPKCGQELDPNTIHACIGTP